MTDVVYSDQYCYTGDIKQAHAVCFGLINAANLYKKTFVYNYYDIVKHEAEIEQAAIESGVPLREFPFSPHAFQLMREEIFDNFLIGTFFELTAKATLLSEGFLVHKIKDGGSSDEIKALRDIQKKEPVRVAEYLKLDSFQEHKSEGKKSLQFLEPNTLKYNLLYSNTYAAQLPFSSDYIQAANTYRILRNEIHFPLVGVSEAIIKQGSYSITHAHEVIKKEWEIVLRPLYLKLRKTHSFNFFEDISL